MNRIFIFILILLTAGCCNVKTKNSGKTKINVDDQIVKSDDNIRKSLVEVAQSIERSLATLAASQETKNPPVLNTAPLITAEGGMGGTADIDWTGPIEPLLTKIADMSEYKLKILGNVPTIPIMVSITQNKSVIADILKNAALQAGRRATVVVFPANKVIELRYKAG